MRLLSLSIACVLAGCATTETVWRKAGITNEDWYIDSGQCKAQAFSVPGAPMMQIALVYNSCLQGKGWHQEQVPR